MIIDRIIKFFTSLKLTVTCLILSAILVFVGTIAQVDLGLYNAQNMFFRGFFVWWQPKALDFKIPVFPGGYLVGGVLLINLTAAFIARFSLSRKKIGIVFIHSGIILMLLGQLATDFLQVESHMKLSEGEARNYSENGRQNELVFIDESDPSSNEVFAVSEHRLAHMKEIRHEKLPFVVKILKFLPNSRLSNRAPMMDKEPPPASEGLGRRLNVVPHPPTTKMDERNLPSVILEIVGPNGSLGTWLVSNALDDMQTIAVPGSKTYQVALRSIRYYKPFYLELLKFSHDKYRGTEIPKNFSSRVRIKANTGEDREVLIYMNNPLRYWGETYYQAGYDDKDPRVTILQVVRNPSWLTPYFSCILVSIGLTTQFLTHLLAFVKKKRTAAAAAA